MEVIEKNWLRFVLTNQKPKTKVWMVESTDRKNLGKIEWYPSWRKYAFFPEPYTIFETICLTDIRDFIEEQMKKHKEKNL